MTIKQPSPRMLDLCDRIVTVAKLNGLITFYATGKLSYRDNAFLVHSESSVIGFRESSIAKTEQTYASNAVCKITLK